MSEILIKGITLPKNQDQMVHVGINRLGKMKASKDTWDGMDWTELEESYEVQALPKHGRLFDHDVVLRAVEEFQRKHNRAIKPEEFWRMLDRDIPCFMEASK